MRTHGVHTDSPSSGSRPGGPERRERNRLRDLCDEVLASFRLASDRDPISQQDREAAVDILQRVAPLARA